MEFFGRSGATLPGDSLPPTNQRLGLRSASDLPRDSEAADGVGEQESGSLEEAPEVPMTLRGATKVSVGSRVQFRLK